MNESELTKKRFLELARKSYDAPYFIFTDFLGLMEQAIFRDAEREFVRGVSYTLFGGCEGAERVMVRFGSEEELGYSEAFPIVTVKAEPISPKFAEKLTHRDYLGSILALGIERSTIGDIAVREDCAYIFAKEEIAPYVIESLTKVRRTDVKLSAVDSLPAGALYKTERRRVQAQGERVDAVIAKLFQLSRDDSQSLFKKGLVFADGRQLQSTSYVPKRNELISVRGYGRFIYLGYETLTKKGKLNIEVDLFI